MSFLLIDPVFPGRYVLGELRVAQMEPRPMPARLSQCPMSKAQSRYYLLTALSGEVESSSRRECFASCWLVDFVGRH